MSTVIKKKLVPAPAQDDPKPRTGKALEDCQTPLDRIMAKLSNSVETGNRHSYLIDHEVPNYDLTLDKDGNLLGIGVSL